MGLGIDVLVVIFSCIFSGKNYFSIMQSSDHLFSVTSSTYWDGVCVDRDEAARLNNMLDYILLDTQQDQFDVNFERSCKNNCRSNSMRFTAIEKIPGYNLLKRCYCGYIAPPVYAKRPDRECHSPGQKRRARVYQTGQRAIISFCSSQFYLILVHFFGLNNAENLTESKTNIQTDRH